MTWRRLGSRGLGRVPGCLFVFNLALAATGLMVAAAANSRIAPSRRRTDAAFWPITAPPSRTWCACCAPRTGVRGEFLVVSPGAGRTAWLRALAFSSWPSPPTRSFAHRAPAGGGAPHAGAGAPAAPALAALGATRAGGARGRGPRQATAPITPLAGDTCNGSARCAIGRSTRSPSRARTTRCPRRHRASSSPTSRPASRRSLRAESAVC